MRKMKGNALWPIFSRASFRYWLGPDISSRMRGKSPVTCAMDACHPETTARHELCWPDSETDVQRVCQVAATCQSFSNFACSHVMCNFLPWNLAKHLPLCAASPNWRQYGKTVLIFLDRLLWHLLDARQSRGGRQREQHRENNELHNRCRFERWQARHSFPWSDYGKNSSYWYVIEKNLELFFIAGTQQWLYIASCQFDIAQRFHASRRQPHQNRPQNVWKIGASLDSILMLFFFFCRCNYLIAQQVYAVIVSHPAKGDLSPATISYTGGFYHIPIIGISSREAGFSDKVSVRYYFICHNNKWVIRLEHPRVVLENGGAILPPGRCLVSSVASLSLLASDAHSQRRCGRLLADDTPSKSVSEQRWRRRSTRN